MGQECILSDWLVTHQRSGGRKIDSIEVKRAIAIQHILTHMMGATTQPERSQSPSVPRGNGACVNAGDPAKSLERKRKTYSTTDTVKIWKSVFGTNMEGVCKLCSETKIILETRTGTDAWEISHLIPFSEGGTDDLSNLRPLCRGCNRAMGKRQFKAFAFENYPERFDEIVTAFSLE